MAGSGDKGPRAKRGRASKARARGKTRAGSERAQKRAVDSTKEFEKAVAKAAGEHYVFRLFVTGTSERSQAAIANIRKFCDMHLAGHYELEVVDIYQQPEQTRMDQIIASPTLVKRLPSPLRKMVGDFSDDARVLVLLGSKRMHARNQTVDH